MFRKCLWFQSSILGTFLEVPPLVARISFVCVRNLRKNGGRHSKYIRGLWANTKRARKKWPSIRLLTATLRTHWARPHGTACLEKERPGGIRGRMGRPSIRWACFSLCNLPARVDLGERFSRLRPWKKERLPENDERYGRRGRIGDRPSEVASGTSKKWR